jgi:hypothetical protein
MVLKNVAVAIVCALLTGWSGAFAADEYRPDQFLGLDLSRAVLSPKPLGPPNEFWPVPVEARGDHASEGEQAAVEPATEPKVVIHKARVTQKTSVANLRAEKPRGAARAKLARRHGNPLDAQALDTRVQVWPCRSGGICNWKR